MSEVLAAQGLQAFCLLPPALCLKTSFRVDHQNLTRTHIPFDTHKEGERSRLLQQFVQTHREDLDAITTELAKITSLSPEEITPYFDTMLAELVKLKDDLLCETATPQQRSRAFREWAESHREMNLPYLSDYAVSRESMYDDDHL